MEEYITRAEFEQFKKQVEQMTEPMRAINVNVASQDVLTRLDNLDQKLDRIDQQQGEHAKGLFMHSRSVGALQEDVRGIKMDTEQVKTTIDTIKTIQNGHSKFFEEHGKRLAAMATKEELKSELSAMEGRINENIAELKKNLIDTVKQLWSQRPSTNNQEQE